jgi:hypothetical protein
MPAVGKFDAGNALPGVTKAIAQSDAQAGVANLQLQTKRAEITSLQDFLAVQTAALNAADTALATAQAEITALRSRLNSGSVYIYVNEGPIGQLADSLDADIGNGLPDVASNEYGYCVSFVTPDATTWVALQALLRLA